MDAMYSLARSMTKNTRQALLSRKVYSRILVILLVVGISAVIFVFRDQIQRFGDLGYLGAFLISLITSATLFLPVPGIALVFALGAVNNPILIGLVAGIGSTLGETTGYMAGYGGQIAAERSRVYSRLERWMKRRGSIVIFVLSLVPNPFFDAAGATAGMLKYPLWKFLLFSVLGKIPKYMIVAVAGRYAYEPVIDFFKGFF